MDLATGLLTSLTPHLPQPFIYPTWLSTYENILRVPKEILSETIVYLDEIHVTGSSSFRVAFPQLLQYILKYAKTVVGLSGTMNEEVFDGVFDTLVDVHNPYKKDIIINNITCPNGMSAVAFAVLNTLQAIEQGKKCLVLIENTNELKLYEDKLREYSHFSHENSILLYLSDESRLTVENRSEAVKVIATGIVPNECLVFCGTSSLIEGYDLKSDDEWLCIVAGAINSSLKTPEPLIQFSSRIRNDKPIVVNVQRNKTVAPTVYKDILTQKQIEGKLAFQHRIADEAMHKTGTVSQKYLTSFDDSAIENNVVPAFEMKQSNINVGFAYGREDDYGRDLYEEHALKVGAFEVVYTELESKYKVKSHANMASAVLDMIKSNPHQMQVTEILVDEYLKEVKGVELPVCVERYIATSKEFNKKAKQGLLDVMRLLRWYKHEWLVEVFSDEDPAKVSTLITHINIYIKNGIELYKVTEVLQSKMGSDWCSPKQVAMKFKSIPDKYFNGKNTAFKYKNVKRLGATVNNFLDLDTKKVKGTTHYKAGGLIKWFNSACINEQIRWRILKEYEHKREQRVEKQRLLNLKKDYANYVEFFDVLEEVA